MTIREPLLKPVAIEDLKPTQMTVGLREVQEKVRRWREKSQADEGDFLGRHMIPVARGPKGRAYVLDHHHLCRALHEAGQTEILVNVIADLDHLAKAEFWVFLDNRGWCHPYDAQGKRRSFEDIPKSIEAMADDPYRSLAGELRRAGGYAKAATPFVEFVWADFLRRRIEADLVAKHFATALSQALALAHDHGAAHLPGWCGPDESD